MPGCLLAGGSLRMASRMGRCRSGPHVFRSLIRENDYARIISADEEAAPHSPSPRLQLHNVVVNDAIQHCWQNRWDEVRSVADLESVSRLDRVHERLNTLRSSHAAPLLTDTSLLRHREFPRRCVPHSDAIEREPLGYAARPSAN